MSAKKPLVEAIAEYDRTSHERSNAWTRVETNEDADAAEKADTEALMKVREAFYLVTKDINSRENCMRCDIGFMRKISKL